MPNRILRDWTDSFAVNELDAHEERFFVRLIMKADDFGRFHADVRLLKANLFPLLPDTRDTDISRWIAACEKAGLIRCYVDGRGRQFLEIQNFRQRTRQSESRFPAPPPDSQPIDTQPPPAMPMPDANPPLAQRPATARQSSDSQAAVKRQSSDRQLRTETETYSKTETQTARASNGSGNTPFDSFDDPLAEMAQAVATAMGQSSVPEGHDAEPIHAAARVFVDAGVRPSDVGEYERDYYRRKAKQGSNYPLTLKILRSDLPPFVRAKQQREAAGSAQSAPSATYPPVVSAPPNYKQPKPKDKGDICESQT